MGRGNVEHHDVLGVVSHQCLEISTMRCGSPASDQFSYLHAQTDSSQARDSSVRPFSDRNAEMGLHAGSVMTAGPCDHYQRRNPLTRRSSVHIVSRYPSRFSIRRGSRHESQPSRHLVALAARHGNVRLHRRAVPRGGAAGHRLHPRVAGDPGTARRSAERARTRCAESPPGWPSTPPAGFPSPCTTPRSHSGSLYLLTVLPGLVLVAEIARRMANLLRIAQVRDPFTAVHRASAVDPRQAHRLRRAGHLGRSARSRRGCCPRRCWTSQTTYKPHQSPLGWLAVGLIFAAFGRILDRGVAMRAELDTVI